MFEADFLDREGSQQELEELYKKYTVWLEVNWIMNYLDAMVSLL